MCAALAIPDKLSCKGFLLLKNPRHIAGHCLTKSEHKKARGHEIRWEHIELNADPQHKRNAKDTAEQDTRFPVRDQQTGGGKVCQTVDNEQRAAGKVKFLNNIEANGNF